MENINSINKDELTILDLKRRRLIEEEDTQYWLNKDVIMGQNNEVGQKNLNGRVLESRPPKHYELFSLDLPWAWEPTEYLVPKIYYLSKVTQIYLSK